MYLNSQQDMKTPFMLSLLFLVTFLIGYYGDDVLYPFLEITLEKPTVTGYTLHMLFWRIALPIAVLALLYGWRAVPGELYADASVKQGLSVALLVTGPMLIGYALMFRPALMSGAQLAVGFYSKALGPGLNEELFYRAFLFGQLFRRGRWPFILAVAVQGVVFGVAHLYQAHGTVEALLVFGVTFAGALWFAWLWLCWRSLWVPMFIHTFMNGWWMLFDVSESAVGGIWANVFRAVTIALSVWLTIRHVRARGDHPLRFPRTFVGLNRTDYYAFY